MGKLFQYFRFRNEGAKRTSFLKCTLRSKNFQNDVIEKTNEEKQVKKKKSAENFYEKFENHKYNENKECCCSNSSINTINNNCNKIYKDDDNKKYSSNFHNFYGKNNDNCENFQRQKGNHNNHITTVHHTTKTTTTTTTRYKTKTTTTKTFTTKGKNPAATANEAIQITTSSLSARKSPCHQLQQQWQPSTIGCNQIQRNFFNKNANNNRIVSSETATTATAIQPTKGKTIWENLLSTSTAPTTTTTNSDCRHINFSRCCCCKCNSSRTATQTATAAAAATTTAKTKSRIYGFMKDFLRRKKFQRPKAVVNNNKENIYVELPNNFKVINNNLGYQKQQDTNNCLLNHQQHQHQHHHRQSCKNNKICYCTSIQRGFNNNGMQDVRIRFELQPQSHGSSGSSSTNASSTHQRPIHLFEDTNLNGNEHTSQRSPSSEEDNSPTEMNNCRRLVDKPPLVKRLTMGLLRSTEDSRPLVHHTATTTCSSSLNNCGSSQTISDGYVNEGICEPEKFISSKFGDSCRQSLTALPSLEMTRYHHDVNSEFNCKKKYLRETSSANSSPKIFSPSAPLRLDYLTLAEQNELKSAPWFQAGIPREISLEVLSRQSPGAFLVRQSSTKPGCFALSLRVPPPAPKVAHYLILRISRGYKIKGFTKEFSSLRALITHHSVMPELLPVPLTLPRPHQRSTSRRALDDFDSYDSLNDFRK